MYFLSTCAASSSSGSAAAAGSPLPAAANCSRWNALIAALVSGSDVFPRLYITSLREKAEPAQSEKIDVKQQLQQTREKARYMA
jgi:hypothetical protein